jgi:chemotaxis signal transduction protein
VNLSESAAESLDDFLTGNSSSNSQNFPDSQNSSLEVMEILGEEDRDIFQRNHSFFQGKMNFRGEIVNTIDIRQKQDMKDWDLLFVRHGGLTTLVAVDSDARCLWISVKGIENVPTMIAEMSSNSLKRLRVHRSNLSIYLNLDNLDLPEESLL